MTIRRLHETWQGSLFTRTVPAMNQPAQRGQFPAGFPPELVSAAFVASNEGQSTFDSALGSDSINKGNSVET
jgi:hypothetical protein